MHRSLSDVAAPVPEMDSETKSLATFSPVTWKQIVLLFQMKAFSHSHQTHHECLIYEILDKFNAILKQKTSKNTKKIYAKWGFHVS